MQKIAESDVPFKILNSQPFRIKSLTSYQAKAHHLVCSMYLA